MKQHDHLLAGGLEQVDLLEEIKRLSVLLAC